MKNKRILFMSIALNFIFVISLICVIYNNSLNDSDTYKLDESYINEIIDVESNFELCEIKSKYSDLWYDKIILYNDVLIHYYSNDETMKAELQLSHDNWLEYKNTQEEAYMQYLLSVYTTGSIVPIEMETRRYELNRERAIFLYQQCQMLFIEVEKP